MAVTGRQVTMSEQMHARWVKSSRSFSNGNCVEAANLPEGEIGVRDSRRPEGPVLRFTPGEWDSFVARARLGEVDRVSGHTGAWASSSPSTWMCATRVTRPELPLVGIDVVEVSPPHDHAEITSFLANRPGTG